MVAVPSVATAGAEAAVSTLFLGLSDLAPPSPKHDMVSPCPSHQLYLSPPPSVIRKSFGLKFQAGFLCWQLVSSELAETSSPAPGVSVLTQTGRRKNSGL